MITEIPSRDDFQAIGLQLLNTAWDAATSLLLELEEARWWDRNLEKDEEEAYWESARIQLSTALSVAQQGGEFMLKARIATVSPFLLLSSSPKDWPKDCAAKDTPFSAFRTIDAQDLIKVHDTFCPHRLPRGFSDEFDALRKTRNTLMHSIDRNLTVHASELLKAVLMFNDVLGRSNKWVSERRAFLETAPKSHLHSTDWADFQMVAEFAKIRDVLPRAVLKEYFGFDTRRRTYICPHCSYTVEPDAEIQCRTAVLQPNRPDSTKVYCFVCTRTETVERTECPVDGCPGNVLSPDHERCLTCDENTR
jgi:hypothetical protein